ncbi:hypothetical protein VNO77_39277 [Canavalia gladiata]|uniref:Uncharacterized protein n=1 Tax=Canavalia gladiata TaxID=3824 RepID=A0AAN9KD46_CANGL
MYITILDSGKFMHPNPSNAEGVEATEVVKDSGNGGKKKNSNLRPKQPVRKESDVARFQPSMIDAINLQQSNLLLSDPYEQDSRSTNAIQFMPILTICQP